MLMSAIMGSKANVLRKGVRYSALRKGVRYSALFKTAKNIEVGRMSLEKVKW